MSLRLLDTLSKFNNSEILLFQYPITRVRIIMLLIFVVRHLIFKIWESTHSASRIDISLPAAIIDPRPERNLEDDSDDNNVYPSYSGNVVATVVAIVLYVKITVYNCHFATYILAANWNYSSKEHRWWALSKRCHHLFGVPFSKASFNYLIK